MVLRIEDTDQSRYMPGAEDDINASLAWTGLTVDESPSLGGPYGPYRQSERKALYQRHVRRLIDLGWAYYAFDTPEEVAALRKTGAAYDMASRMSMSNSLSLPSDEVTRRLGASEPYTVRLLVPDDRTVQFEDIVRGPVAIASSTIDDQVLLKSDGMPTYHLAAVVDDHHMAITHVIRGDEWLPSVPKHMLLYEAFGWDCPAMAHLPLILSPTGGKLSKRSAKRLNIPVNVGDYRQAGYEPESLINFLAFLGWNPGTDKEVFTLGELERTFGLDRVGSAPAKFDLDKLQWFNAQHLRRLEPIEVLERADRHLKARELYPEPPYALDAAKLVQSRMTLAGDLADTYEYLFRAPDAYDPKGVRKRWKHDSAALVKAFADKLQELTSWDEASLESALRSVAADSQIGAGRIIHPVRLAVSGTTAGPSLFAMLAVLGKPAVIARLERAVDSLQP